MSLDSSEQIEQLHQLLQAIEQARASVPNLLQTMAAGGLTTEQRAAAYRVAADHVSASVAELGAAYAPCKEVIAASRDTPADVDLQTAGEILQSQRRKAQERGVTEGWAQLESLINAAALRSKENFLYTGQVCPGYRVVPNLGATNATRVLDPDTIASLPRAISGATDLPSVVRSLTSQNPRIRITYTDSSLDFTLAHTLHARCRLKKRGNVTQIVNVTCLGISECSTLDHSVFGPFQALSHKATQLAERTKFDSVRSNVPLVLNFLANPPLPFNK